MTPTACGRTGRSSPLAVFALAVALLCAGLCPLLASERAPVRKFDIPASAAAMALRQFASQSGEQLVFSSEEVKGVSTRSVRGSMTADEALAQLLADTPLLASRDEKSGTIAVARAASPNVQRAAPANEGARPAQNNRVPAGDGSETVAMSPFTVRADSDVGYVATSSLAGSRLNTELKDTPSAISVLTAEFLSDIGATDLAAAADYVPNLQLELSEEGIQGNRLVEFYTSYRIRGIRASSARNYFEWNLPSDTYNVERIDQSRGPNAILFGIGSAGGMINASTKQAQPGKSFRKATLLAGSNDAFRTTFDLNQALPGHDAAVRFNAVWGDEKSYRHFEFRKIQAAHLSGKWRPFAHTTLRAEGEMGYLENNQARPWTVVDLVGLWSDSGRPTFAAPTTNATLGVARYATGTPRVTHIANTGQLLDLRGTMLTSMPAPINNSVVLDRSFVDYSVNPAGPGAIRTTDFSTYTVTLEQRLGARTYVELAFNRQRYDFTQYESDSAAHQLFGDPNRSLATGAANPFAGGYFVESNWYRRTRSETIDNLRLTASTEFDFGKLGRYRLAGLAERQRSGFRRDEKREYWAGTPFSADPEATGNLVWRRNYVTEGEWGSYRLDGGKGQLINAQIDPVTGRTLSSTWIQRNANIDDDPSELRFVLAAVQARFFDGRVVGTAGLRRDELHSENRGTTRDPVSREIAVDYANVETTDLSFHTQTAGLVAHVTPWLSAHYNRSNNSGLPNVAHRILPDSGRSAGSEGVGEDAGFTLTLLRGKAFFKAGRYTTDSRDETDPRSIATFVASRNDRVLNTLVAAGRISAAEATARRVGANATRFDRSGEGLEFELVANPSSDWRLAANYTNSRLTEAGVGDEAVAWAGEAIAYWRRFDTGLVTSAAVPIATEIANLESDLNSLTATNGVGAIGNRRHKLAVFARHDFDGALKGLYLGGGYRYQSAAVVGWTPSLGLLHGNALHLADALLGYRFRPTKQLRLSVQLNVANLFDFDDPQITIRSPEGLVRRAQLVAPRAFRLTSSAEF